jgi:hypothetical protein
MLRRRRRAVDQVFGVVAFSSIRFRISPSPSCDVKSQELSQSFTDHGAATRQRVLRRVLIDCFKHGGLFAGEHGADGHSLPLARRGRTRPFLELGKFTLDLIADCLVPLFLFWRGITHDPPANLIGHHGFPLEIGKFLLIPRSHKPSPDKQ